MEVAEGRDLLAKLEADRETIRVYRAAYEEVVAEHKAFVGTATEDARAARDREEAQGSEIERLLAENRRLRRQRDGIQFGIYVGAGVGTSGREVEGQIGIGFFKRL